MYHDTFQKDEGSEANSPELGNFGLCFAPLSVQDFRAIRRLLFGFPFILGASLAAVNPVSVN